MNTETKAKHTLGPLYRHCLTVRASRTTPEGYQLESPVIAEFIPLPGDRGSAEAQANAQHLVDLWNRPMSAEAQAELLAAAEAVILESEECGWGKSRGTDEERESLTLLRAAIAKARS